MAIGIIQEFFCTGCILTMSIICAKRVCMRAGQPKTVHDFYWLSAREHWKPRTCLPSMTHHVTCRDPWRDKKILGGFWHFISGIFIIWNHIFANYTHPNLRTDSLLWNSARATKPWITNQATPLPSPPSFLQNSKINFARFTIQVSCTASCLC